MAEAYIVDAVRTPVGRRGGGLSQVHPADLGAHSLRTLVDRTDIDPSAVEDVIFGCVDTIGPQAGDIARTCWLAAGLPDAVPGTTVDRQCGSSQQAVHFAAQAVLSGTADLIVAGGVQSMSQIPISSAMLVGEQYGFTDPFSGSKGWVERYGDQEVSQFRSADMIAEKWDISREDMEEFALESHRRAVRAIDEGRFERRDRAARRGGGRRGPATRARHRKMKALATARARAVASPRRSRARSRDAVGRDARRLRAGREGPQPHAAGAHPPPVGARRRPGLHAHRPDPGHARTRSTRPA